MNLCTRDRNREIHINQYKFNIMSFFCNINAPSIEFLHLNVSCNIGQSMYTLENHGNNKDKSSILGDNDKATQKIATKDNAYLTIVPSY